MTLTGDSRPSPNDAVFSSEILLYRVGIFVTQAEMMFETFVLDQDRGPNPRDCRPLIQLLWQMKNAFDDFSLETLDEFERNSGQELVSGVISEIRKCHKSENPDILPPNAQFIENRFKELNDLLGMTPHKITSRLTNSLNWWKLAKLVPMGNILTELTPTRHGARGGMTNVDKAQSVAIRYPWRVDGCSYSWTFQYAKEIGELCDRMQVDFDIIVPPDYDQQQPRLKIDHLPYYVGIGWPSIWLGIERMTSAIQQPPPPKRPKRSTRRGDARDKLVSALSTHHPYQQGSVLNTEPIGVRALAKLADVAISTASVFLNEIFMGLSTYRTRCSDAGSLADRMKMLNGEYTPRELRNRYRD